MKKIDKRNPVYFAAQEAWARYPRHLSGLLSAPACVVSEHPLAPEAQDALDASVAALGYGHGAITYVILEPQAAAAEASPGGNQPLDPDADPGQEIASTGAGSVDAPRDQSAEPGQGAASAGAGLSSKQLYGIVEAVDPLVLVAADARSMALLSRAYRVEFAPAAPARLLGRTAVGFVDFSKMLAAQEDKQRAWAHLKKLGHKPKPR